MEYQSFVEFDNPTYLPKGDDVASGLISIPAEGLKLGDVIQHTVFVSFNIITLGTVVSEVGMDLVVQACVCCLSYTQCLNYQILLGYHKWILYI